MLLGLDPLDLLAPGWGIGLQIGLLARLQWGQLGCGC